MQTNCKAFAKVVVNNKLQTLRLLVTFDNKVNANGKAVITVLNAAYKSGDLCDKNADTEVIAQVLQKEVQRVKHYLRTENVVFVD